MIFTLNDLIAYTHTQASVAPATVADELRITRPGCTENELRCLSKALPGIPESYLSVIGSMNINGVVIGYFELTPGRGVTINIVEKLSRFNDMSHGLPNISTHRDGAYLIAKLEADPIGIIYRANRFEVGQVVLYEHDRPEALPGVLADSFEQFLLIAGNLDEILGSRESPDDWDVVYKRFGEYLEPFIAGRRDNMAATWARVIG